MNAYDENIRTNIIIEDKQYVVSQKNNNAIDYEENKQILLLFKQLISYYNFRKIFKQSLNQGKCLFDIKNNNNSNNQNEQSYIQNTFCFIDKKFLEEWRNHIGYELIIKELKNKNINISQINNDDYKHFQLFIGSISKNNYLLPYNSKKIYKNKEEIEPKAEFAIINTECYKNFVFPHSMENKDIKVNIRHFPIKFLKEKLIIMINLNIFQINYKENYFNKYFELLIEFEENNERRKIILDFLEKQEIDKWLKGNNFDIMRHLEKSFNLYNCKFNLITKINFLSK